MFCVISVGVQAGILIAKEGIAIAKEGIETLDKGLDLYNKHLDKIIPWSEFNKTIAKLNEYRSDYSKEAGALIGDIQTKLRDGLNAYFRATQTIFQWCGLAVGLLEDYKSLFVGELNQDLYNTQRDIILEVLKEGIEKMVKGREELTASSASFSVATGKLTDLNIRLAADFNENSDYYQAQRDHIRKVGYGSAAPFLIFGLAIAAGVVEGVMIPRLNEQMRSIENFYIEMKDEIELSKKNINLTENQLNKEIAHIGELENKAKSAQVFVKTKYTDGIRALLLKSVDKLITNCKEYRARHRDTNPLLKDV